MLQLGSYVFKRAETSQELDQLFQLNYRTFVNEIPQHHDPGGGRLVDKFHHKNIYFIALRHGRVVGMVSAHDQPPFSTADRLQDPRMLEQPGSRPLEVRLLAIEPAERHGVAFAGLLWSIYEHVRAHGYTHLFISGLAERVSLYEQLGFEALGPAVRSGNAAFVPMAVSVDHLEKQVGHLVRQWEKRLERLARKAREPFCLLPGPVQVAPAVRAAFARPPLYHRGPEFITLFEDVRATLARLTGAAAVALFNGSGTLANEVIAATLAADPAGRDGLILVNGEFGARLVRQAARFSLRARVLSWPWGRPWDLQEVETALRGSPRPAWIWGAHLESSTGMLNDLPGLVGLAREQGVHVCADCVSSLGAVHLDLSQVYLASGATGKSLGAYAGAAVVFTNRSSLEGLDVSNVPSYLDLPAALAGVGPRFTFPASVLQALAAALAEYETPEKARARYDHYAALGRHVRQQLRQLGLAPLVEEPWASPVLTTFTPPAGLSSEQFVARCRSWGFAVGGQSRYLAERRLAQIATMGAVTADDCAPLFFRLGQWLARAPEAALQPAR